MISFAPPADVPSAMPPKTMEHQQFPSADARIAEYCGENDGDSGWNRGSL